jgi:hypothetical protein
MNRLAPLGAVLLVLLHGPGASAQEEADYFPTQTGRSWTYTLTLEANDKQKKIEYTTKVERTEEIEGKPCAVFVSRSRERLIKQSWYLVSDQKVVNSQQKGGTRPAQIFANRVLFENAAVKAFKGTEPKKPSWEWTCNDGSSGTVTLERRERLFLGAKVGDLRDCLVVVDRGVYHTGKGDKKTVARTTDHTMWFAPGLGLVKEVVVVKKPDGTVNFRSEALLLKFQTP